MVEYDEPLNIRAEFGRKDVEMVPVGAIVELYQVRRSINEEELRELKQRIPRAPNGEVIHYDLVHPVSIAKLDESHAIDYILDHLSYFSDSPDNDEDWTEDEVRQYLAQLPTVDGDFYIRIAGHMRGQAILLDCEEEGIDPWEATVSGSLKENISFEAAMRLQNIENTRVQMNPVDDATEIVRHRKWLQQRGRPARTSDLAEFFGYSEDKIRSAIRFSTAPPEIQAFVGKGLNYTNVVDLVKLREAYEEAIMKRERCDRPTAELGSYEKMTLYFDITLRKVLEGERRGNIAALIDAKIKEVNKSAKYITDELFEFDAGRAEQSVRVANRRMLGGTAIQVINYLVDTESLTPDQRDQLLLLLSAKSQAAPQEEAALF